MDKYKPIEEYKPIKLPERKSPEPIKPLRKKVDTTEMGPGIPTHDKFSNPDKY